MREELVRQLGRRRTIVVLVLLAAIPAVLAFVFAVRGAPEPTAGVAPELLELADGSALAFAIFVLYLTAPLVLLVAAALFGGDPLASESSWGTLRYVLVAPVPRSTVLAQKLGSGILLAGAAVVVTCATSLVTGTLAFGWQDVDTPAGGTIPAGIASARLALSALVILVTIIPFAAIALAFATFLRAPLAAVGAAVAVALVSQILDVVPTLGAVRVLLPTHYAYAWLDLFVDPVDSTRIAACTLQAAIYAVLASTVAWVRFVRGDVLS